MDNYYIDYIDGYPSIFGYQLYVADDFDRAGTRTELFNALEIERSMPTGTEVLFYFNSGIRYQIGYRVDCNCAALICEEGSGSPTTIPLLDCSLNYYQTADGYDYNADKVATEITLDAQEKVGVCDVAFDGQLIWDEHLQTYRQINAFELCAGFPICL